MTANGVAISSSRSGRRYDVDALRVFAFALLILYHAGMFYVAEWEWHVKSAYQSEWLQLPMSFTNQWRMPLLFVISGLAISFVEERYSAWRLAGRRLTRLLVPLTFGMLLVVAPQPYYEALAKGLIEPGFVRFMADYLTFSDFPGEAWDGENDFTWTWNHLWYLPYLLSYTLILIPVAAFLRRRGQSVRNFFQDLGAPWLILLPVLPFMAYVNFVFPRYPYVSHGLFDDWYAHAMYFTFFFYGYLMGGAGNFWASIGAMRRELLVAGTILFAILYLRRDTFDNEPIFLLQQANYLMIYMNRWIWILALLAWGHRLLDRPLRWLPYATEAVYPWYILHQTIIVVAGYELSRLSLGPIAEPLLLLAATSAGCFVLYEFAIRRVRILRPLFGVSY